LKKQETTTSIRKYQQACWNWRQFIFPPNGRCRGSQSRYFRNNNGPTKRQTYTYNFYFPNFFL